MKDTMPGIQTAYDLVQERYAEMGVDTDRAIALLDSIPISGKLSLMILEAPHIIALPRSRPHAGESPFALSDRQSSAASCH